MNMHVGGSKFKVGDRVKVTELGYFDGDRVSVGDFAAVIRVPSSGGDNYELEFSPVGAEKFYQWHDTTAFIPAPLFAVGDKVRVVKNLRAMSFIGSVGSVTKTTDGSVGVHIDGTGERFFDNDEIEPAYTSCAAAEVDNLADEYGGGKFREGDRVRMVKEGRSTTGAVGKLATIGSWDGRVMDDGDYLLNIDAPHDDYKTMAVRPQFTRIKPDGIESATLTIQAGRYYKTRDGRMVGPMERNDGGFKWSNHGEVRWVDAGGKHRFGLRSADLIAEWSDDVPLRGVSPVVAPATTAKFKVGDRVKQRCWGDKNWCTVVKFDGSQMTIRDDNSIEGYYDNLADFITTPTTIADIVRKHSGTAIVCLIENGQPKPSTLPFVHLNKDAAATEANRLAGIHKGQEFGVYTCIDVRKVERVYEHEWQRLAASGSKIPAIKAYRDAGGKRETFVSSEYGYRAGYENRFVIGLKEAKDAVEYWLASAA